MQIKRSTLKLTIIFSVVAIIISITAVSIYYKNHREQQRKAEIEEYVSKAIDREYKDLLRDYEYYAKEALDSWNSRSSKERAIRKINHLLGERLFCYIYEGSDYIEVAYFESQYKEKDKEAKSILKRKAIERAAEKAAKSLD